MNIGFGTYRVNPKNQNHFDAIDFAIKSGINVFEISSNYSSGEIEKQLAQLINSNTRIILKAGYVQANKADELKELEKRSETKITKVHINDNNYFCIDPLYLDQEIDLALKNLNVDSIETFHLNNPENLFLEEGIDIYDHLEKSFRYLEELIKLGKIKNYGISSNTFVLPKEEKNVINLEKVFSMKKNFPGFKSIQFPLNLIELGALEKQFYGKNLIEFSKENNVEVIINRPLNAFTEKGLLRLAEYQDYADFNEGLDSDEIFVEKIKTLKKRFDENKDDPEDQIEDIALLNQIKGFWYKQISKDAVDQVFFNHFFPLVANIWGEDLTSDESQSFYDLYDIACDYARKNMNLRAVTFKDQAIESGLLDKQNLSLQQMAIEKYRSYGVDICLVGMRQKNYVKDFIE